MPTGHAGNHLTHPPDDPAESPGTLAPEKEDHADAHDHTHSHTHAHLKIGPPWDPHYLPGVPSIILGIDNPAAAYKLRA